MSMIRKRSHSNTNVSKKEKPPQQESGMAHPFSGHADYSPGTADEASENELWVQLVMHMRIIVDIKNCCPCPSIFIYLAVQKCDCGPVLCALR